LTLAQANVDLSVADGSYFPPPVKKETAPVPPAPEPEPEPEAALAVTVKLRSDDGGKTWTVDG
jgi:hypothetical protein